MANKTVVFIDAENVSKTSYETKYRKKIKTFAKNHGLSMEEIEFRAYAVEGGPTANKWYSEGVVMNRIPGAPASDKADNRIAKEIRDQADKNSVCLLLTHDKGLQNRVNESVNGVYIFDE